MTMTQPVTNRFPLRIKVALLLAAALGLSLISYAIVGTRLIVADKVSYIYDYNLAQVRTASEAIETQIFKVRTAARALDGSNIGHAYEQLLKPLGVGQVLVLRASKGDQFESVTQAGDEGLRVLELAAKLGWRPASLGASPALIGTTFDGILPVMGRVSESLLFLAALKLESSLLETQERQVEIHLVDGLGRTVLARSQLSQKINPSALQEFEHGLLKSPFPSGVREWTAGSDRFLVGYRKLEGMPLLIASYVPHAAAFEAASSLWRRSMALGTGILLVALGATLWLARGVTRKLREMGFATRQVAKGDFGVRIDPKGLSHDEVGELAVSFNTMSDKIADLMVATATKARMEKELETAQALQSRFFPQDSHQSPQVRLGGRYMPASECAGDWWHYCQVGPYLITVIGDVTGHGVSSALVTAAVHGAFSLLARELKNMTVPSLEVVLSGLNAAVLASAQGTATMTFLATRLNTETGEFSVANASHLAPYVRRAAFSGDTPVIKRFEPIMGERAPALGREPELKVQTTTTQLLPGDTVFLYTDGMTELPGGKSLPQRKLFDLFDRARTESQGETLKLCDSAMAEVVKAFEVDGSHSRPDDVTLVTLQIPAEARFAKTSLKIAS